MTFNWPTNDTKRVGSLQKLRSKGVAETLPSQDIDDWLKESIALVAGCVRGLGMNQRKVRHFAFETAHEQSEKG
jgi:hypothetical protein